MRMILAVAAKSLKPRSLTTPLSSPLEGEEDAARVIALGNKSTSPRQVEGTSVQRAALPLPLTPALPLVGGGRECDTRDWPVGPVLGHANIQKTAVDRWVMGAHP